MQNNTIEGYRLSPQQQRLWLLQPNSESSPYRVQAQVAIEGNLNPDILLGAFQTVVNRHENIEHDISALAWHECSRSGHK